MQYWVAGAMFTPSIFEDRCVNFRRSMCRPSEIKVSIFEDRCELMLLGCLARARVCVCVYS